MCAAIIVWDLKMLRQSDLTEGVAKSFFSLLFTGQQLCDHFWRIALLFLRRCVFPLCGLQKAEESRALVKREKVS